MLRPLLVFLFCFFTLLAQAQAPLRAGSSADSLRVVRAAWRETRLGRGLVWHEAHFDTLFGSPQNINFVLLKNRRRGPKPQLASAGDSLRPTSWFGKKWGARVALNGTFFDVKNGGSVDFIKIAGRTFDSTRHVPGKPLAEHQQAAIVLRRNRLRIVFGGDSPGWELRLPDPDVMVSGPLLLQNGKPHPLLKNAFNANRHPRTALGLAPRRRVLLLTADGRNANAAGLSLPELTALLRYLGCREAINFDGGGSTTLWLSPTGVVNYPSDSKQWIHTGERAVSNVLLLK